MVMLHWNNSSDPLANQPAARPANRVGHENGGGGPFGGQKSDFFQKKWGPRGPSGPRAPGPGGASWAEITWPRGFGGLRASRGPGPCEPRAEPWPPRPRKKKAPFFSSASHSTGTKGKLGAACRSTTWLAEFFTSVAGQAPVLAPDR